MVRNACLLCTLLRHLLAQYKLKHRAVNEDVETIK